VGIIAMTNIHQLTAKIVDAIAFPMEGQEAITRDEAITFVKSLLREAMEGEYKKGIIDSSYSEGLKDAYTRAVKTARSLYFADGRHYGEMIATAIEQLKEEIE
jgi:hypothetical protein